MKNMVVLQTSKNKPLKKDVELLMKSFPNWKYEHYTDEEILEYFKKNKIEWLPDPEFHFLKFSTGAHRADFFRYYYLYLNGGVFIDSDLMIYKNINEIIDGCDFSTCFSNNEWVKDAAFQGFLFSNAKNKIIENCLKDICDLDKDTLNYINLDADRKTDGYQYITRKMYEVIKDDDESTKIIYTEKTFKYLNNNINRVGYLIGKEGFWFGVHWNSEKEIPSFSYEEILQISL